MRIACRLRTIRKERGLSLRDLERLSGIGRGHLSRIERGMMLPSDDWADVLERELGAPRAQWYVSPSVAGVVIESDDSEHPPFRAPL